MTEVIVLENKRRELEIFLKPFIDELRPLVRGIESGVQETQFHYGKYLNIVLSTPEKDREVMLFGLLCAGANINGMNAVRKLI